ncbi:MAG: long-chain fatty acid--CoA ligase [Thermoplasmata archaeon]
MGEPADPLSGRIWLKKYGKGVPPTVEIPDLLLSDLIEASVRRYPDRTALVYYGAKWTYRQFWEASGRLAAALARDGIGPGDRVAIYLPNGPLYPIAVFAVLRLGGVVVQVSPLYLGQDLTRILLDAEPKALITLEILYPNVAKVRADYAIPTVVVGRLRDFYPFPKSLFVNTVVKRQKMSTEFPREAWVRPWRAILRTAGTPPPWKGDPATTVAILQYTGGTTGRPKAAMLTHRNLVANVTQSNAWNTARRPGEEVIMASIPFFHIYGLTVAMFMGLAEGSTLIIQTRPEIRELLRLIDRYRPTQFPGVPALYQAFNQQPDLARFQIRSIRYCLSGSAPLPLEVARRFESLTGASLVEGYGLSETSPVTHVNPVEGERRVGSIGIPLPNTDERLVALDDPDRVLGPDEVGELAVRGPQVMLGYYHQPEETALFLKDGWFRTGDVARIDADGYAYIVDRKKDMVNVSGMKVYPREVEEILFQHPGVADVACIGVPDPEHGEVVKAFVVKKPGATVTEDELREFVRGRIAHFKAPRSVEFRDALPRTGVQKVLRRVLREQAAASAAAPTPTTPGK